MDRVLVESLAGRLQYIEKPMTFMEVCGTHTMEIGKLSLRNFLKDKVRLISGPGCPVCVTPSIYIDYIYSLAINEKLSIITYGDMLRVPGTSPNISLEKARALGGDIRVVYSSVDSINVAKENKDKTFVFVGIGFETTMPSTGILIKDILNNNIKNLFILSLHKRVEPVMKILINDKDLKIDGFLCPGNVAVIIGEDGFSFINEENQFGVISGFKEDEIISSIINLIDGTNYRKVGLINNYKAFVSKEGNLLAKNLINNYFDVCSSRWRGIGNIEESGYELRDEYKSINILEKYPLEHEIELIHDEKRKYVCRCGDVLKGKITPKECESFKKFCTPAFPIGPCMVSGEGTCAAYYKYEE